MVKISVGSQNPVKIDAVKEVFEDFFDEVIIAPQDTDSGVQSQPINEEIMKGAIRRARDSQSKTQSDYGVGIEGGLIEIYGNSYFLGYIAITDSKNHVMTGTSGLFPCPNKILPEIKAGRELGDIIDEITGKKDVKRKEGAIGIWTKGAVSRKDLYKHGIYMTLVPFLNKELFEI